MESSETLLASDFATLPALVKAAQSGPKDVRLAAIVALERAERYLECGVDALFIGPADLAASMGHVGNSGHPEVVAAIELGIRDIVAAGKPAGILTLDHDFAQRCIGWGTTFTAVGMDIALLANAARSLSAKFRAE